MLKYQTQTDKRGEIEIPVSGIRVTPMDTNELHRWIAATWEERRKTVILGHNLHSLYTWEVNPTFRAFYDKADVVLTDGFPILKWPSGSPGGRSAPGGTVSAPWTGCPA